jgi:uncharacterized membrane protein YedE/YeeE
MCCFMRWVRHERSPYFVEGITQAHFVIFVFFFMALGIQAGITWFVVSVVQYPISTNRDAYEYVSITENVLSGHGFAIERESRFVEILCRVRLLHDDSS